MNEFGRSAASPSLTSPSIDAGSATPSEVAIAPDDLLDLIRQAYVSGCEAVQTNYRSDPDPEFGEAGYDYVASLDLTEVTRPLRTLPGWRPMSELPERAYVVIARPLPNGQWSSFTAAVVPGEYDWPAGAMFMELAFPDSEER